MLELARGHVEIAGLGFGECLDQIQRLVDEDHRRIDLTAGLADLATDGDDIVADQPRQARRPVPRHADHHRADFVLEARQLLIVGGRDQLAQRLRYLTSLPLDDDRFLRLGFGGRRTADIDLGGSRGSCCHQGGGRGGGEDSGHDALPDAPAV